MSGIRRLIDAIHELLDIPLEDAEQLVSREFPKFVLELSPHRRLDLCAMLGVPLYARSHTQPAAGAGNNNMSTLSVPQNKNIIAVVKDAVFGSDSGATLISGLLDAGNPATVVTTAAGASLDRRPGGGVFAADGAAVVSTGHRVGAGGGAIIWNQNSPATTITRILTLEGAVVAPNRSVSLFQGTANIGGYYSWRWYEVNLGSND